MYWQVLTTGARLCDCFAKAACKLANGANQKCDNILLLCTTLARMEMISIKLCLVSFAMRS